VRCVTEKLVQSAGHQQEFADSDAKLFSSIILARPVPDEATVTTLKALFPGAIEITFPRQVLGARYVTLMFLLLLLSHLLVGKLWIFLLENSRTWKVLEKYS